MSEDGSNEDKTRRAMEETAELYRTGPANEAGNRIQIVTDGEPAAGRVPSGIEPLDLRVGGLAPGGVYLFAGPPGPEKTVAILQFIHHGVASGERGLLLAGSPAENILEVAQAWGCPLEDPWRQGRLEIVGFRDDFEMRVLRATDPEDVLEELARLAGPEVGRVAVDPGSMFLQSGARTLLGRAFLEWARSHPATVCATLSLDNAASLPSSAEWLLHGTRGVFHFERRPDGFVQIRMNRSVPGAMGEEEALTLQLRAGAGLIAPVGRPGRRRSDRPSGDADHLLLVTLGEAAAPETEEWARATFDTDVVADPLGAVARLQGGATYGSVLVQASRDRIQEVTRACRAIRPMTGAALVVVSEGPVRSTDRIQILKSGADDCLSGVIDFRELGARIRQAVAAGGKAPPPLEVLDAEAASPVGGTVGRQILAEEVDRRASGPETASFSLLRVQVGTEGAGSIPATLARGIRKEEGDLVVPGAGECLVLLQGARQEQAKAFLARMRDDLSGSTGQAVELEAEVLVNPRDRARIREVVGGSGGQEA